MRMRNSIFWGALGLAALGGLLSPRAARGQMGGIVHDPVSLSFTLPKLIDEVEQGVKLVGAAAEQAESLRKLQTTLATFNQYYEQVSGYVSAGRAVRESGALAREISAEYKSLWRRINGGRPDDVMPQWMREGYSRQVAGILDATTATFGELTQLVQPSVRLSPDGRIRLVNECHAALERLRDELRGVGASYNRAWAELYHDRHQFDFFDNLK